MIFYYSGSAGAIKGGALPGEPEYVLGDAANLMLSFSLITNHNQDQHRRFPIIAKARKEVWGDVLGSEGFYKVSSFGRVKSLKRTCSHFTGQRRVPEKLLIPQEVDGYLRVGLRVDGKQVLKMIHHLVWIAFRGEIPDGLEPNHKDGIKANNRLTNLELLTHKGNMEHAKRTGLLRPCRGEKHGAAKLTEELVVFIRKKYARLIKIGGGRVPSGSVTRLAENLDVDKTLIYKIVNRQIWRCVE